ncbi:Low-density lipoprotein receptor-related protein 2 like protein [Argiope bruennichi]|uniref:Low-density lipoprotein receptor-related protein 2 like protein n=1 Tax=Argiope bruennichi TaxID=94029 RepID=A0A8T0EME5_ARGBR|nr:Low-density lipoprotein receptor-related protein 2 like protein [Argiope bruennichi]
MDTDLSSTRPKGRIFVSELDGRYRHAIVTYGLEQPTSLALDPEYGFMYWTDAGIAPKIEGSWMEGSKRKILVSDRLGYPTGITIDYAGGHRLYWCDTKLDTIETVKMDGADRVTVLSGLNHPISLDLFEDHVYWLTRDSGEIWKNDKFGRGVKVRVRRGIEVPTAVKIYHPLRYNTSVKNRCPEDACSHLCLLIPGGYRCACPDGSPMSVLGVVSCNAGFETPKPQPYRCPCKNGGHCHADENNKVNCLCAENFSGIHCEEYSPTNEAHSHVQGGSVAAIVIPIFVILLVLLGGVFVFYLFKKRHLKPGGFGGSNQSVSFRSGTNVEFSPTFMGRNGPAETMTEEPLDTHFNLGDFDKPTDFSNPMYDVIGTTQNDKNSQLYEVPSEAKAAEKTKSSPAVLQLRKTALDPMTVDTDKDTAQLVVEDKSEC